MKDKIERCSVCGYKFFSSQLKTKTDENGIKYLVCDNCHEV